MLNVKYVFNGRSLVSASCVHFVRVCARLPKAYGQDENGAVPPDIVGGQCRPIASEARRPYEEEIRTNLQRSRFYLFLKTSIIWTSSTFAMFVVVRNLSSAL